MLSATLASQYIHVHTHTHTHLCGRLKKGVKQRTAWGKGRTVSCSFCALKKQIYYQALNRKYLLNFDKKS